MTLNIHSLKSELEDYFENQQGTVIEEQARKFIGVYINYAEKASSSFASDFGIQISHPDLSANVFAAEAKIISAYKIQQADAIANGIAKACELLWTPPPAQFPNDVLVTTPILPNVWVSTVVQAVTGTSGLSSSLKTEFKINDPAQASAKIKAQKFASYFELFTKSISLLVTLQPPSGPPITQPATVV